MLGRVLHALGFRWVFPIGTLPVPFHPAFLPLVLAALVVWTTTRIVSLAVGAADGVGGSVLGLAVGFLVVGMMLSVPVLAWVVLALGGRLVQALLALAAMLLLSMSVATGKDPPWLAVLPAAYAVTWAAQAVGGRVALARIEAAARRHPPLDVRGRAVVLPEDLTSATADDLLVRGAAGVVWQRSGGAGDGGRGRVVLSDEQAAELLTAARDALPGDVSLGDVDGRRVLSWTGPLPPDASVVDVVRRPDPGGLLGDELWRVTVEDRSVVTGRASLVLPVPMLNAFHWTSLTSRSESVVGFGRGRPRDVGPGKDAIHLLAGDGEPIDSGTGVEVLSALDVVWRDIADRDAAVERLRAEALTGRVDLSAHRRALDELRRGGARLLGDDAAAVLATWLTRARDGRDYLVPGTIARLVDTLPDELVRAHGELLVDAFNSRKLALRWQLTPDLDVTALPRDLRRFGTSAGFGVALDQPALFARLGDLVPAFRPLVAELHREMTLAAPVADALERWDVEGRGPIG